VDFAGGTRSAEDESRVADTLAQIDYIDGIICNTPNFRGIGSSGDMARSALAGAEMLAAIPSKYGKPVVTLRWRGGGGGGGDIVRNIVRNAGIPSYDTPEQCVRAMWALMEYARIRKQLDDDKR
jgi:acyl-CoA synthetase (NDP forming)